MSAVGKFLDVSHAFVEGSYGDAWSVFDFFYLEVGRKKDAVERRRAKYLQRAFCGVCCRMSIRNMNHFIMSV